MSVHPRVCGEQSPEPRDPRAQFGSSPRVRGTVYFGLGAVVADRFIPACAGNSARQRVTDAIIAVHPRVCGEQCPMAKFVSQSSGSSPRVRGTVSEGWKNILVRRFIPACAGNRCAMKTQPGHESVHPRVCGEQNNTLNTLVERLGSSPRVRGTVRDPEVTEVDQRFIPACAGNSIERSSAFRRRAVHPRVCGEQQLLALLKRNGNGSSPRVRGTAPRSAACL